MGLKEDGNNDPSLCLSDWKTGIAIYLEKSRRVENYGGEGVYYINGHIKFEMSIDIHVAMLSTIACMVWS